LSLRNHRSSGGISGALNGGVFGGVIIGLLVMFAAAIRCHWTKITSDRNPYVVASAHEIELTPLDEIPTAVEYEQVAPSLPSASASYSSPPEIVEIRILCS